MNMEHLAPEATTVFEALDDAGVRTAGTTYLIYRGRHEHDVSREFALSRIAAALWRRSVLGPRELFYADIFASRETGCRSQMGIAGHARSPCRLRRRAPWSPTTCSTSYCCRCPDNDTHSHKHGPHAQVASIAEADRQMVRMMDAGGGIEAFLDDHAVIVMADHSHALVERRADLGDAFVAWTVMAPNGKTAGAEIALCPNSRAAMVYVLVEDAREALARPLAQARRWRPTASTSRCGARTVRA